MPCKNDSSSGEGVLDTGYLKLDTGCLILDTGCLMLDEESIAFFFFKNFESP